MKREWTDKQKLAINARGSNLLVSASAGSGKTAVLVERIIRRVIDEKIDIDRILALTFTNAAASELKHKIEKAVVEALKNDSSNMHLMRQINLLNRASITTIHSFCLDIVRSNFYKIGIDPSFSICDDTKAKLMQNKALNEILEEEYKRYNDEKTMLYDVLELFNMDEEKFLSAILKLLNEINCYVSPFEWLEKNIEIYNIKDVTEDLYNKRFGSDIYDLVISNLNLALNKCTKMREELLEKKEEFFKYIEVLDEDMDSIKRVINCSYNSWDKLYENLSMIVPKRMPSSAKIIDEKLKEKFSSFRTNIIKDEISKSQSYVYDTSENINKSLLKMYPYLVYIAQFTKKVSNRYFKMKNEENVIDFTDIEHYALDILLEKDEKGNLVPTKEAKECQEKFDEIYVDEYQDTSFIQEEILNSISRGGTLSKFMVGDIKQSIYRFRKAVPSIFLNKYLSYNDCLENDKKGGDKKIILAKNFRSRKEVLDGINYIFEQIMSLEMGDCNYSLDEVLVNGNNEFISSNEASYKFEINILDEKEVEESSKENEQTSSLDYLNELKSIEKEAIYVAKRIDSLVNKEKFKITDKGSLRDITYSDICILFRNQKSKSDIFEKTLKSYNIPVYNSSLVNLWDNDEVRLILSFLKVLDNPYQEIEMISIMYSILGGFTLDEIYEIKSKCLGVNIYSYLRSWDYTASDSLHLNDKIKSFTDILNKYISYVNILSVSDILSRLYSETGMYNYVLFLDSPTIRKMNLDSLIEIASNGKNYNVSEFISYIEALKEKMIDSPDTSKTSSENENVVKMMTIHKSKGLEFPVVVLASASSKYLVKDLQDKIVVSSKYGIGIDCVNKDFNITYPSIIKEAINKQMILEMKSEELRMLYVALTRAKEKVITYISLKDLEKSLDKIYVFKDENGKIQPAISKNCNSYKDLILLATKNVIMNRQNDIFDINHILIKDTENLKIIGENIKSKKAIKEIIDEKKKEIQALDRNKIDSIKNDIASNLDFKYNYMDDVFSKRRVSVSDLKKKESNDSIMEEFTIPDVLSTSSEITALRRGTLIHLILENINYQEVTNEDTLNLYLNSLIEDYIITKEELDVIDKNIIVSFIKSNVAERIRKSRYYKKEVEFVYSKSKFSSSMIQGVIDLYYEEDDGTLTIIDFKTDKLFKEADFVDRYYTQLAIYKEALAGITGKEVKHAYIYSFNLKKELEIK